MDRVGPPLGTDKGFGPGRTPSTGRRQVVSPGCQVSTRISRGSLGVEVFPLRNVPPLHQPGRHTLHIHWQKEFPVHQNRPKRVISYSSPEVTWHLSLDLRPRKRHTCPRATTGQTRSRGLTPHTRRGTERPSIPPVTRGSVAGGVRVVYRLGVTHKKRRKLGETDWIQPRRWFYMGLCRRIRCRHGWE